MFRIRTKRDPEAFARIYDRYVGAIYRFAYLKLPRKEEAQDITAETFTRAWQYLMESKRVVHIRAFLYQIARNLIIDFYRTKKEQIPIDEFVTKEAEAASSHSEWATDLSDPRAELTLIFARLSHLKEDYRDVLLLRLVDGLSYPVIGEILEKKPGHIRVIFHRALKVLREIDTGNRNP